MFNYEYTILNHQENEVDDCANCPFASPELCKNQCMEVQEIYNPNLRREK